MSRNKFATPLGSERAWFSFMWLKCGMKSIVLQSK